MECEKTLWRNFRGKNVAKVKLNCENDLSRWKCSHTRWKIVDISTKGWNVVKQNSIIAIQLVLSSKSKTSTLSILSSFFPKNVFTSCSRWKSKDTSTIENCKNLNVSRITTKNFFRDWNYYIRSRRSLET